ncbi:acyltransferase family protein [Luteimicrobium subarcticum]|uniref:Peptidoglycan/LPS O-acetylase OafA/YrhL n=1 Tax=Luteimicrobium subarcticum TaxID=620910 RepID=A0A2M8WVJ3_9MICO|nr:acyltransferase [Luteimicrobium subarcticum]PJI94944.1 peptidoglycan/LPS O-acetylase OafA/YrhL [Luteimicrobium subarcticum]
MTDTRPAETPTAQTPTAEAPTTGGALAADTSQDSARLEDTILRDDSAALPVSDALPTIDKARAAPGNTGARFEDLEGYRGIAAIGIVVFHAYQFCRAGTSSDYAYQGTWFYHVMLNLDGLVSLFLVLSAFLLFLPIARKVLTGVEPGSASVFTIRRALRILPLYWGATLLVWAYRNPTMPGDWRDLVEHLTFTQVFDNHRIFYTIGPAWSLSVEVWFYAFLALLLLAYNRFGAHTRTLRTRRVLVWAPVVVLGTASLAYQGWALATHVSHEAYNVWFNPLAKGSVFVGGMVLALVMVHRDGRQLTRPWLIGLRLGALALLVWGMAIRGDDAATSSYWQQLSTVAFVLLLASSVMAPTTALWRRALMRPWLLWAGLISYSVYLWHEPVLLFLDQHGRLSHAQSAFPFVALVLVLVSLPVGWLSYWVIEYPVGRLRMLRLPNGLKRSYYPSSRVYTAAGTPD